MRERTKMLLVDVEAAFFAVRELIGLAESSRRLGITKDGCAPEDYEAAGRALTPVADGGEAVPVSDRAALGLVLFEEEPS